MKETLIVINRLVLTAGIATLLAGIPPGGGGAASAQSTPATWTLDQCLDRALDENRSVRDAELDVELARKQIREAWAGVYPTVDANVSMTRNLTANEIFLSPVGPIADSTATGKTRIRVSDDNSWLASVSIDQPLFQAEVFIGVGAAKHVEALRLEEQRGQRQQTVTEVRRLYYDLLLADELVRLTGESIRRQETTLDEARAMNRVGVRSDYDVLRLDVELANLRPALQRAENGRHAARRRLNIALSLDVDADTRVAGRLREMDVAERGGNDATHRRILELGATSSGTDVAFDAAWATGHGARSDLRQLEITETLARAQWKAERATNFPRLFAFGSYQLSAQENGSLDFFGESEDDRTDLWQAGLRLEIPIFDGFGRPARMAQRRVQIEQVHTRTTLAEDAAQAEILAAIEQLEEARQRAAAQRHAVDQATRGYQIASIEFREGVGSQLQLTDAEVALRQTEFNYAESVHAFLNAQASLDLAVGVVPHVD